MTHDLTTQAELVKLARALATSTDQLGFADTLPSDDIKQLRERISNRLFDEHRHEFRRVAATTKLVPAAVAAKVAERAIAPILSASIAGELPPEKAGDLVGKFSTAYLADICVEIDPRVVAALMGHIPVQVANSVAQELVQRREFITLGRLIDAAPANVLRVVAGNIAGDEALLRIGLYAESPGHLGQAIEALPADRVRDVVHLGVSGEPELQAAGLSLMGRVTDDVRARLGNMAAEADDAALTGLLDTAISAGAVAEMLAVVAVMSDDAQRRVLALPPLADDKKLGTLVKATAEHDLWARLLPVSAFMRDDLKRRLGAIIIGLPDGDIERLLTTSLDRGMLGELLSVVAQMEAPEQRRLMTLPALDDDRTMAALVDATADHDLWTALLPLCVHLDERLRRRLAGLVRRLESSRLKAVVEAAHSGDLWGPLLGFAAYLDPEGMVALFKAIGAPSGEVLHGIVVAAETEGLWPTLLGVMAELPEDGQRQIAGAWEHASVDDRELVVTKVADLGLDGKLAPMRDAMGLHGLAPGQTPPCL